MAGSLDRAQVSNRNALPAQTAHNRPSTPTKSSTFTLEEFFILDALRDRELYGLQIVRALSAHSDSGISLGRGVIYPTVKTLAAEGMLRTRQGNGGPPRTYYALTNAGWERYYAIAERLAYLGETARSLAADNRPRR